jgi:hypothetical protein
MLLVGFAAAVLGNSVYLGLLASFLIAATIWRSLFPVTYLLDPQHLSELTFFDRRQIPWAAVKRLELTGAGVLLIPTTDKTPLVRVHARYLPWCGHRERVTELLNRYTPHAHRVEM